MGDSSRVHMEGGTALDRLHSFGAGRGLNQNGETPR